MRSNKKRREALKCLERIEQIPNISEGKKWTKILYKRLRIAQGNKFCKSIHSHFNIKHDSRNIFVHFPNEILPVRVSNESVTRWIPTIANCPVPKSRYHLPKTTDTLAPIRKLLVDPLSVKTA